MVLPLVFRHGAAETAFTVTVAVWAVFELVMRVRQRFLSRGPAAVDRSAFILLPCMAGSVVLAEVLGHRGGLPWPGGPVWPFAAGALLPSRFTAPLVTVAAFFALGFGAEAAHGAHSHWLISPGIADAPGIGLDQGVATFYPYLPDLSMAQVMFLGGITLAVLGGLGLAVRIRAEERQLTDSLGEEYERFAADHKRLVPGVW